MMAERKVFEYQFCAKESINEEGDFDFPKEIEALCEEFAEVAFDGSVFLFDDYIDKRFVVRCSSKKMLVKKIKNRIKQEFLAALDIVEGDGGVWARANVSFNGWRIEVRINDNVDDKRHDPDLVFERIEVRGESEEL